MVCAGPAEHIFDSMTSGNSYTLKRLFEVCCYNYLFSFSKFHAHHHDKMLQWKQQTTDCYLHAGSFLSQDRKGYPSSVTDVHLKGSLRFAAITTCSPSPNFTHISMTRCYNGNNRPVIVVFRQAVF